MAPLEKGNSPAVVYLVCASTLSCVSRIWGPVICPDSEAREETKQNQVTSLELDGNAKAIGIIFRTIHYDFIYRWSPTSMNVLIFYYTLGLISIWTSRLKNIATQDDYVSESHRALYVGWVFGSLHVYREAVDTLIVTSRMNTNGKIVNICGQPLEDMMMPPYILDKITEIRGTIVAQILSTIKAPIDALSSGDQNQDRFCGKYGRDSEACETMMLGSAVCALTKALTKAGLFPIPDPEVFTGSIEDLREKLENIKTIPFVGRRTHQRSHENCNLGFQESARVCL
ncbi:hypothetical protein GGR50DRAFT_696954 [Xylaria sp. CBS 124048]|nr:hypothetical protein GGR50DRAFT_696954 [Xylaria sp. CBS 124048]